MLHIGFLFVVFWGGSIAYAQNSTPETSPCYPLLEQTVNVMDKIASGINTTNGIAQQIVDKVPGIQSQFEEILDYLKEVTSPGFIVGVAAGTTATMVSLGGLIVWTVNSIQSRFTCTGCCPAKFDWKPKPGHEEMIALLAEAIIQKMKVPAQGLPEQSMGALDGN